MRTFTPSTHTATCKSALSSIPVLSKKCKMTDKSHHFALRLLGYHNVAI
jgi:hypothetical protein